MATHIPKSGQIAVIHSRSFMAPFIRLFTQSQMSHAFVVLDRAPDGDFRIGESQAKGFNTRVWLSKYDGYEILYSDFELTPEEVNRVIRSADLFSGTPYAFLDIVVLGLQKVGVHWRWLEKRVAREDRAICSQSDDTVYANAGLHLYTDGRLPGSVTPGDLLLLIADETNEPSRKDPS